MQCHCEVVKSLKSKLDIGSKPMADQDFWHLLQNQVGEDTLSGECIGRRVAIYPLK